MESHEIALIPVIINTYSLLIFILPVIQEQLNYKKINYMCQNTTFCNYMLENMLQFPRYGKFYARTKIHNIEV